MKILDLRQSLISELADPFETVDFHIPFWMFEAFAAEHRHGAFDIGRLQHCGNNDPAMMYLARMLLPAFGRPDEASALYTQHMFNTIANHLATRYGGLFVKSPVFRQNLTKSPARRAKDLLMSRVQSNITLPELAGAADFSVLEFSRAFRRHTGPNAISMADGKAPGNRQTDTGAFQRPLEAVAASAGFASQAHFSRVFTKTSGKPPDHWRAARRH